MYEKIKQLAKRQRNAVSAKEKADIREDMQRLRREDPGAYSRALGRLIGEAKDHMDFLALAKRLDRAQGGTPGSSPGGKRSGRGAACLRFLKNWSLPIAMLVGAFSYLGYAQLPLTAGMRHAAAAMVGFVQPMLIFSMLFITFCKIEPRQLRLRHWHLSAIAFQVGIFVALAAIHLLVDDMKWQIVLEGGMACMICPTATAAAVVTAKLGGDAAGLTAYTILINLTVGLVVPAVIPLIHPSASGAFFPAFFMIMGKVFPLLIGPLVAARLLHYLMPRWQHAVAARHDLAFHFWAMALALAVAVTVRSIMHSHTPWGILVAIAAVSLAACAAQFAFGRFLGNHNHAKVSAAQALGQKNTVFAIWMGYTFLTPVTSIAGGFYSIWHNVYNSWQLYQLRKKNEAGGTPEVPQGR